jgi:YHS domain-containing protein
MSDPRTRTPGRRHALPAILGVTLFTQRPASAQRVFTEGGVALRGYDPVAYFTEARPVRGRPEFETRWQGVTWRFASAAHRDRFVAEPQRYAPSYGGFCAFAVSEGYTAPVDPAAWRIVDGRLFLNYDLSVQRRWERDMQTRIQRGDANWPEVERSGR